MKLLLTSLIVLMLIFSACDETSSPSETYEFEGEISGDYALMLQQKTVSLSDIERDGYENYTISLNVSVQLDGKLVDYRTHISIKRPVGSTKMEFDFANPQEATAVVEIMNSTTGDLKDRFKTDAEDIGGKVTLSSIESPFKGSFYCNMVNEQADKEIYWSGTFQK